MFLELQAIFDSTLSVIPVMSLINYLFASQDMHECKILMAIRIKVNRRIKLKPFHAKAVIAKKLVKTKSQYFGSCSRFEERIKNVYYVFLE